MSKTKKKPNMKKAKKETVCAVYWYDARSYNEWTDQINTLERLPHICTIGTIRKIRVKKNGREYTILNVDNEILVNKNNLQDVENKHSRGTAMLEEWVDKIVPIGKI